jgi:hypothetical protein
VAAAVTGSIGSSVGDVPTQRNWYVGGVRTVRGQVAGTQSGDAFWLGRAELGTRMGAVRPVVFFDIGWAGSRKKFGIDPMDWTHGCIFARGQGWDGAEHGGQQRDARNSSFHQDTFYLVGSSARYGWQQVRGIGTTA